MLYICTKISENVCSAIKVVEKTSFHIKNYRGAEFCKQELSEDNGAHLMGACL